MELVAESTFPFGDIGIATRVDRQFGYSLALSGNTIAAATALGVVSDGLGGFEESDQGLVTLHALTDDGIEHIDTLYPNNEANQLFGRALEFHNGELFVGDPRDNTLGIGVNPAPSASPSEMSGALRVYGETDGDWELVHILKSSNSDPGDHFGYSFDVSGSTIACSSPYEDSNGAASSYNQLDNSAPNTGAVYMLNIEP